MSLRFFYSIRNTLKENNICVIFYYNKDYIKTYVKELEQWTVPDIIIIKPTMERPSSSYDLWIGHPIDNINYNLWSMYYETQQDRIVKHMNLEDSTIDTGFWIDEPYLLSIYQTLPIQYHNIDILVINSSANSGQYSKGPEEMDALCRFLNKSYTIVTTRKVDDITCTLDSDLRIRDIGALATHCKYVIAIMTGPINGLMNRQTQTSVKKWFLIVSDGKHYAYKDINYDMITDGNLSSIYTFFSDPSILATTTKKQKQEGFTQYQSICPIV